MTFDKKYPNEPVPPWDSGFCRHWSTLKRESYSIPIDRFVPYCHHMDDCPNPSWLVMPLMVLGM